jgi:glutamate carboxypeptidase
MANLAVEKFSQKQFEIIKLIGELVSIESPSTDKAAVDRLGNRLQAELRSLAAEIQVISNPEHGNHLRARWGNGSKGILLLAHMDTVLTWEPWRNTHFGKKTAGCMGQACRI